MSYPVYYVLENDTLPVFFDSFDGGTGASITQSGFAVTDIEIYKDGGTTQRSSDAGYTLLDTDGIDFDAITGIHGFSIDLSDNTDAGFYAVGPWYHVVVSSITVDGQTVNFVACAFRILDTTRGMTGTALPNAAAEAAGGLYTRGTGAGQINQDANGRVDVNIEAISADATAPANLEADYDGTGYNKSNSTIGTTTTNTDMRGTDNAALASVATEARLAELDAANLPADVDAILADTGSTGVLLAATATSAQLVDDVWDEALTAGAHNVANSGGKRLRELQESGAVYGGYIWIDTVNGSAGTDSYVNGTSDNPSSTIGDANTLAAALGITRFKVAPGSSITFAATQSNQLFEGDSWTLALGGQNIDGSTIMGATVSGIATNTSDRQYFINCHMNAATLPGDTHLIACSIAGTQTVGESGDYFFDQCYSAVAGAGTPVLNINSVANVNVNVRHYSGGLQVNNGVATTTISYESNGQVVVDATCTSLSITVRGNCSITDNGTTTSLTQDAAVNRTNINAEADTALSDYDGPTNAEMEARTLVAANYGTAANQTNIETDTQDIQSRLPAALVGGRMDSDVAAIQANVITATAIAANALTSAKIATDAFDAVALAADAANEIRDAVAARSVTLPGQEAPPAAPTADEILGWLYKVLRNRKTQTATQWSLLADDESTVDAKATVSDDGTTAIKQEIQAGP